MQALGIHIYAGGFSLGVKKHFDIVGHLENSNFGVDTVKANFKGLPVYTDPESWPVEKFKNVPFVYGNPPCRFFSTAGCYKGENLREKYKDEDPVDHVQFQSVCFKLQPKIFCFESVPGILTSGAQMLSEFAHKAFQYGYAVTHLIVNGKNHGLPQSRKRVFIIAHKVQLNFDLKFKPGPLVGEILKSVKHIKDQYRVAPIDPKWQPLLKIMQPGDKLRPGFKKMYPKHNGGPSFLKLRLDNNNYAPTILGDFNYFHPTQNRFITITEMKALCGYPESYKFTQCTSKTLKELVRAVLPGPGEYLARNVKQALIANKKIKVAELNVIDLSK
jgi:site-specific DNA-cytosine methylase